MRIHLITLAAFPHTSAESIHLAMFSKSMNRQSDFKLVTPFKFWRPMTWTKSLDNFGVVGDCFNQKKYIQLKRNGLGFIRKSIRNAKRQKAFVYSRQYQVAAAAVEERVYCAWEIHSLPDITGLAFIREGIDSGYLRKVVLISNALKKDIMLALNLGESYSNSFFVAADAADESKFSVNSNFAAKPVAGYIGSVYKGKGAEIIFPLARVCKNVEFVLYGVSLGDSMLKGYGEIPSNLVLKGKIPYRDVPKAMESFDIALLPNQPDIIVAKGDNIGKYTSPMKMFEYMASGKAIIASDLDILKEVLDDYQTALLVKHDDIEAWKMALEKLTLDTPFAQLLASNARKILLSKYTYSVRAENIINSLS